MLSLILMNAYIIDNFMTSFSFILLFFVAALILSVFILLLRIDIKNRSNRKSIERLELMQRAFQISPAATLIINNTGRILLANNSAANLFGVSEEDLRQEFLDAFTIILSSKKLSAEMKESLKHDGCYKSESQVKLNGKRKLCRFSIYSLETNKKTEYMVIIEPKRDRKQQVFEQNLLSARLDEVENAAGIGYWVYDYDTGETIWSRGLYKLLAKPINSTPPDLSFISQFAPESQKSVQNLLLAIKNQQSYYDRLYLIDANGITRIVDLYLKHQVGMDLNVRKSMGVFREVRETAINESYLNYFLPETDFKDLEVILLITTDKDGKVSYLNEKAHSVLKENAIGKDIGTIIKKEDTLDSNRFTSRVNDSIIKWQCFEHQNTGEKSFIGVDLSACAEKVEEYENSK